MDNGVALWPPPVCTGRGVRWCTQGVGYAYTPCILVLSPLAMGGDSSMGSCLSASTEAKTKCGCHVPDGALVQAHQSGVCDVFGGPELPGVPFVRKPVSEENPSFRSCTFTSRWSLPRSQSPHGLRAVCVAAPPCFKDRSGRCVATTGQPDRVW